MNHDVPQRLIARLCAEDEAAQRRFLASMRAEDIIRLDAMYETWASRGQREPDGEGWRTWLLMAGRGFGKTRAGAEWVQRMAMSGPRRRIALVGATLDEARKVMVEGKSGLIAVARRRGTALKWEPGLGRLTWPNGSEATLYSGEQGEGLRGPEHDFAWCDELAKWRDADNGWANLQMGLRLGVRPRALVTTTPRPRSLIAAIQRDPRTVETGGRTGDNVSLPASFVEVMMTTYGGTRLGRQELDGELLGEADGSLFPRALIEASRCERPARFDRVVVGVDPPASQTGDACGIVVCGRSEGHLYVLADCSVEGASPERWARVASGAAAAWDAAEIIAEANQGGDMVESVLRAAGAEVRVRLVHASRGKVARAEPVATRFEAGRASFAGLFPHLEAELAGLARGGRYDGPGRSPDRADAMVWAMTELGETASGVPRVRAL